MTWFPQQNLSDDLSDSEGIIKLWGSPNLKNAQDWRTSGIFSTDLYHYFFIPHNFYFLSNNTFAYHFPFRYIFQNIKVFHDGIQTSEEFWRLQPSNDATSTIQTDIKTKLPYLFIPNLGQPNYKEIKSYFIPVGRKT